MRCCSPPDISSGNESPRSGRPTVSSHRPARALCLGARHAEQVQRQQQVLQRRERRHQVEELEHEADAAAPQLREAVLGKP
jgi:hypothetical protein